MLSEAITPKITAKISRKGILKHNIPNSNERRPIDLELGSYSHTSFGGSDSLTIVIKLLFVFSKIGKEAMAYD